MGHVDPESLWQYSARHVHLPLSLSAIRPGRVERARQGNLRDKRSVWLSACPRDVETGGWFANQKKVRRLYIELGLQLRSNHPKRKVRAKLIRNRKEVVQTMGRICAQTGYPKMIRVDHGSEFISRDLDVWAIANGATLDFSRTGKSTENAFIEAFNGWIQHECLLAN